MSLSPPGFLTFRHLWMWCNSHVLRTWHSAECLMRTVQSIFSLWQRLRQADFNFFNFCYCYDFITSDWEFRVPKSTFWIKKIVMDSPSYKLFNIPKFITVDDVLERDVMNSELIKFLKTENSTYIHIKEEHPGIFISLDSWARES